MEAPFGRRAQQLAPAVVLTLNCIPSLPRVPVVFAIRRWAVNQIYLARMGEVDVRKRQTFRPEQKSDVTSTCS